MEKTQNVIFVAGVSGVGKTTFLKALSRHVDFQHLTASQIIKDQKQYINSQNMTSEELRLANLLDNQKTLIDGFQRLRAPQASHIVIDGHTVIDTPDGLVEIDSLVFEGLGIDHFIFLTEQPKEILKRRNADLSRERPPIQVDLIKQHQTAAASITIRIAEKLSVPMTSLNTNQFDSALHILERSGDFS